jgi:hypothetical protein
MNSKEGSSPADAHVSRVSEHSSPLSQNGEAIRRIRALKPCRSEMATVSLGVTCPRSGRDGSVD